MLSLTDVGRGGSRRWFLKVGGTAALGAGGVTFSDVAALQARAAESPGLVTGKSVIFLFLHGGPSQFETFDPKMTAPQGIRSATGEIPTAIPGVTFGSTFTGLAARADRLNIIRSFVPGDANHNLKPLVGRDTFEANLGAVYARVAGPNDPQTGIPTNVVLFPRSVDPSTRPGTSSFGKFTATGPLSSADAPFDPSESGPGSKELSLVIPRTRLDDRRHLLTSLEQLARSLDQARATEGVDRMRDQAYRLITGGLAEAFDLGLEDPRTVSRFDTAPLVRPENIDRKWKNYNNYVDNAKSLGKLLLLARRLCERGAGFVTVTTNFVWDMHADVNNAPVAEGMRYMGVPLDHALSAFLDDLHARGLQDRILLVACGEMGRTPRINQGGGRDHWGKLGPLVLAGGGYETGRVIGRSSRDGSEPASEPVTPRHLISTVMHTLFDVGKLRLVPDLPREFSQIMASWEPIPGLHG
ncbi:MAG: DUF1501 domain-containing protein [Isosphaeraceae bacterium]